MRMLDKKQIQADRREKVKHDRLEAKRRKRAGDNSLERKSADRPEKPTILIVCEGENTEPSYFNQFKLKTAVIRTVGEGYNTISLVKRAKKLSDERDYDQVWCVFDKDDFPDNDFNNAITTAES